MAVFLINMKTVFKFIIKLKIYLEDAGYTAMSSTMVLGIHKYSESTGSHSAIPESAVD